MKHSKKSLWSLFPLLGVSIVACNSGSTPIPTNGSAKSYNLTVYCLDKKIGTKFNYGNKIYLVVGDSDSVAPIKKYINKKIPLCTSHVTNMAGLYATFVGSNPIKSITDDLTDWDTSNVKYMVHMFNGAESFNQPIGMWDTSKVVSMFGMFAGAKAFNQPIGMWDTSKVVSMSEMFHGASAFNQPLNNWDTSHVDEMDFMFAGAKAFNQPIGMWDTSHVINMTQMFFYASSFNQDLSKWHVEKVYANGQFSIGSLLTSDNLPIFYSN